MFVVKEIRSVPTQELISHLLLREHAQLPVTAQRNLIVQPDNNGRLRRHPPNDQPQRIPVQRSQLQLQLQSVSVSSQVPLPQHVQHPPITEERN
jgi:hypothetical protein